MRNRAVPALLALVAVAGVAAATSSFAVPDWAFPHSSPHSAPPPADPTLRHVPHSEAAYSMADLLDRFTVADWHPDAHPAMPAVVAHGRRPAVAACAYCHLADGIGRPENAMLAGLPAPYMAAQIADFRSRARGSAVESYGPARSMRAIADSMRPEEIEEAARYFSRLPWRSRSRVIEATSIPRPLAWDGLYFEDPRGGTEPLGNRLIEVALDRDRHELHDPLTPYVAYVPPGSLARGRALAITGRSNGTRACASCHGPDLRGVALVPPLAGRSPSYILRQLIGFRTGARAAASGTPMRAEAQTLDIDDMIAVAAYAGSLP